MISYDDDDDDDDDDTSDAADDYHACGLFMGLSSTLIYTSELILCFTNM